MKKIIGFIVLAIGNISYGQSSNYADLGALISSDANYGSARYNGMSGAFGAIGGDLSSVNINPAGGAVDMYNKLGVTLNNETTNSEAFFSDNTITKNKSSANNFNLSNLNGAMVFNKYNSNSKWNRVSLFFNYQRKNNFKSSFGFDADFVKNPNNKYKWSYFKGNPLSDDKIYDILDKQVFERNAIGNSSVFNIGLAGLRNKNLYLGASINFHSFNYTEINRLTEKSKSESDDKNKYYNLDAYNVTETSIEGAGMSLSLGAIYKIKQLRLGLSFETPTAYSQIIDSSNNFVQDNPNIFTDDYYNNFKPGYTEITTQHDNGIQKEFKTENRFDHIEYNFSAPLKFTTSVAWVFGKKGLVSIDYTYKNFSSMNFFSEDYDFINEGNNDISTYFKSTNSLNIGTEWRFNKFSCRAGYGYSQNPNTLFEGKAHQNRFSFGLGYRIQNILFDVSYSKSQYNNYYAIYNMNDLQTVNNTSNLTFSLSFLM